MIQDGRAASARPARCLAKIVRWGLVVILFCAAFLAFDRMFFFGLRTTAARYYASFRTRGESLLAGSIAFGGGDGDLMAFGTSRTRHALNQATLSTVLNKRIYDESKAGRFPQYYYYYYQEYRKTHPRPKVVLYGMDYFMFEKRTARGYLARMGLGNVTDPLDPTNTVNEGSRLLSRISWLFRMKPEIDDYLADAMKLKQDSPDEEEGTGTRPRIKAPPHKKKLKGQRGRKATIAGINSRKLRPHQTTKTMITRPERWQKRPYRFYPGVEGRYFGKLLATMAKEGVPVFLLIIPDYVGTNETNFEQNKFKADVRELAGRYRNVFVLDFNRPDRFPLDDPHYFIDGAWGKSNCHLTALGEKEFSRKIAREVRRILSHGQVRQDQGAKEKP